MILPEIREIEACIIREHRELIYSHGTEASSTKDLLWCVLYPIPREKLEILFANFNIKQLSLLSIPKLVGMGFSQTQATKIQSIFEIARRLETYIEEPKRKICSPKDVYTFMFPKIREQKKEKFITLYLDTKNQILKEEVISIGSLNASIDILAKFLRARSNFHQLQLLWCTITHQATQARAERI